MSKDKPTMDELDAMFGRPHKTRECKTCGRMLQYRGEHWVPYDYGTAERHVCRGWRKLKKDTRILAHAGEFVGIKAPKI